MRAVFRKPLVLGLPLLIFSAFLTEVKFIPSLANNVGIFEILGALLIVGFVLSMDNTPLVGDRLIWSVVALAAVATLSLIGVRQEVLGIGLVQVSILAFLAAFLFSFHNLSLREQIDPAFVLRWIAISAAIVGPWVLRQGFLFTDEIGAVGPFRNRTHMGIYMQTAFWLVLIYAFWPARGRLRRLKLPLCAVALSMCLYAVAISGRRSVYLSLFIGLAALVTLFAIVLRRNRMTVALSLGSAIGFLGLLYTQGGDFLPRSDFFQQRVGMIGGRLRSAADAFSGLSDSGFMAMQAEGIRAALSQHPILGIGWGTFHEWSYNPSGHEVHSTPFKFLAETGVLGLLLYLAFLWHLIVGSSRLAGRMRASPYAASYLILAVAIWSLSISYLYNRHLTERTFWLLLAVFLLLQSFAYGYALTERSTSAARRAQPASEPPEPTPQNE